MTQFSVPVAAASDANDTARGLTQLKPRSWRRLEVAASRDTRNTQDIRIDDQDVVALELDGGFRLWLRGDRLKTEAGQAPSRDGGSWQLAPGLAVEDAERGVGTWVIKALEVFGLDPLGGAVEALAAHVERGNQNVLRQYQSAGTGAWVDIEGDIAAADGPILLCIHGTFSSTEGSFGPLFADRRRVLDLTARYGELIYGYEHRTVTEDPIDNLLALVPQLPNGARLHLLTHSRGGLVGDLLALGTARPLPFSAEDLAAIGSPTQPDEPTPAREDRQARLARLGTLLEGKGIKVERYVRVASPSRGTTLASGRLDRWLSILANLADLSGAAPPLVSGFLDLTVAVTQLATDPQTLPGLAAMMPTAPLVRMLNGAAGPLPTELAVVAGDIEGNSLWARVKLLIPDLFYAGDHDLVVNTGSMYGGTPGPTRQFMFDRGANVNHFSYFTNTTTAPPLVGALTGPYPPPGFAPIGVSQASAPARALREGGQQRPVLFLLPGTMGSRLGVDGRPVWLDSRALATGGIAALAVDSERRITAEGLLAIAYGDLISYFQASHEVVPFAYDWRRSVLDNAAALAAALVPKLEQAERNRQPVRLLAHSTGGLVARALIMEQPQLWRRVLDGGGRLVMLGTANGGSWDIVRLLTGRSATLKQLALLDATRRQAELLGIIGDLPGILELLPDDERDFFSRAQWAKLHEQDAAGHDGWRPPGVGIGSDAPGTRLERAGALRRRLRDAAQGPEGMCYVAGQAPDTPCDVQVAAPAGPGEAPGLRFIASRRGDGAVLWEDGPLPNVPTWYLAGVPHGDLPRHRAAFPALRDLLVTGTTERLSQRPPVGRGGEARRPIEERGLAFYPDTAAIAMSALGMSTRSPAPVGSPPVEVSVVHGNLAFIQDPVAVGHYAGDSIIAAEAYLDRVLGGRPRASQELDLYPGGPGTHAFFAHPHPDGVPRGALVVGLGNVGKLTPYALTNSFARALLGFARCLAEQGGPRAIRLATLLIGTGAGGIDVASAVLALLRGLVRANAALARSQASAGMRFSTLTFVEIRDDLAIAAARALGAAGRDPELANQLAPRTALRTGQGGHRANRDEPDPGWWHRLQVLGDRQGGLRFTFLTQRARAEESLLATQRALVDGFVTEAIGDTSDNTQLSRTLFELLLPNRLKDGTALRGNLVLVLDEDTARFPWELLQDRWSADLKPPAIERGTLRQFSTGRFRDDPRLTLRGRALVIGEPRTGLVPLPGARAEAEKVRDTLAARGFKVTALVDGGASDCLMALHADAWQILHLAGHGVHETRLGGAEAAPVSGMVIGPGQVLTAADVKQMRQVPELVFINCCHLGRTDSGGTDRRTPNDANRLAANLAVAFIEMGVRAVVAAGWAVNDEAALIFCETLYAQLEAGQPFGEAVRRAREATWQGYPSVNTWGAYQCYGDPDFRIRNRAGASEASPPPPGYTAASEAIIDLGNLAADAQVAGRADLPQLRERLATIDRRLARTREETGEHWAARGDVLAARGLAAAELGQFQEAVRDLDAALAAEDSGIDRLLPEQRARCQARIALARHRVGETAAALAELNALAAALEDNRRGAPAYSTPRLQTLSSIYWRRVQVLERTKRRAELENILRLYDNAIAARAGTGGDPLSVYTRLLWLSARYLLAAYTQKPPAEICPDFDAWCDRIEEAAAREDLGGLRPDISSLEVDLLRLLRDRAGLDAERLAVRKADLAVRLRVILDRGLSQRQWTGLDNHLALFETLLGDASVQPAERLKDATIAAELRQLLNSG